MKNTVKLFGIIALAALIGFAITACPEPSDGTTTITWEAEADGVAGTTTSTKITFTFSESVTSLSANDITITNGTGSATKGALTGSGTTWNLAITDVSEGIVSVRIIKDGISKDSQNVTLHKSTTSDITWTLAQVGGVAGANGAAPTASTTAITITFSAAVELTDDDITIGGAAERDSEQALSSSGNVWTVPVTVTASDDATVTVEKTGVEGGEKTVMVYKQGEAPVITWTAVADGTANTVTSTKITFTFSAAVSGLTVDNIVFTQESSGSAEKGALTGSGTSWELAITVEAEGIIFVEIHKDGISTTHHEVTVHKEDEAAVSDITWHATADGVANTTTSANITITFSSAVAGLTSTDFTLTDGTGSATITGLTGTQPNTTWTLIITVQSAGTVSLAINKTDVVATAQEVTVHKAVTTWTVAADGTANTVTSTKITLTFSEAVTGLEASNITLTNGTGSATKGALTGSGTTWDLAITVTSEGTVSVSVTKDGVSATAQNVTVHKEAILPITDGLTTYLYDTSAFSTTPITFSFSTGNSGTYEMESWGEVSEEGSWTWNQSALTITLTANSVADIWASSGEMLDRNGMEIVYRENLEYEVESELDYYTNEDYGEGMDSDEAEAFFLSYYNEQLGTNYTTVEEYIEGETARKVAAVFDPRPYTYTFSSDGMSLILQESPTPVGTNQLSGKTFSITGFEGSDTYIFSSRTYTETASGVTTTGSYSYNSNTKRVYLTPAVIDGQTPAEFYDAIDYEDTFNSYPSETDYRTAKTAEKFATRKFIYNLSDSSLSFDF